MHQRAAGTPGSDRSSHRHDARARTAAHDCKRNVVACTCGPRRPRVELATMAPRRDDLETLRTAVRNAGLRATPSRIAVLRLLRAAGSPVSHSEVVAELASQAWDPATIYRNLTDLSDVGLARRTDVGLSRPARMCIIVDFHEPDGPITAVNWPRGNAIETPSSARTSASPEP